MTRLTRQDVLAHQESVPWPSLYQVEQDLLLCRAMVAIFNDEFLRNQVAMRGGIFHAMTVGCWTKLHPPRRAPAGSIPAGCEEGSPARWS